MTGEPASIVTYNLFKWWCAVHQNHADVKSYLCGFHKSDLFISSMSLHLKNELFFNMYLGFRVTVLYVFRTRARAANFTEKQREQNSITNVALVKTQNTESV